jgi:hypothetical protein
VGELALIAICWLSMEFGLTNKDAPLLRSVSKKLLVSEQILTERKLPTITRCPKKSLKSNAPNVEATGSSRIKGIEVVAIGGLRRVKIVAMNGATITSMMFETDDLKGNIWQNFNA